MNHVIKGLTLKGRLTLTRVESVVLHYTTSYRI